MVCRNTTNKTTTLMKHLFQFWINPEQALNSTELENPKLMIRNINLIFFLLALYFSLSTSQLQIDKLPIQGKGSGIMLFCLLTFVFFLFQKYVFSFLFWSFGKIFQGKSNFSQNQVTLAYSSTPHLILLPYFAFKKLFLISAQLTNTSGEYSMVIQRIIALVVFWYLITSLSKINKYSWGYGLLTVLFVIGLFEALKLIIA